MSKNHETRKAAEVRAATVDGKPGVTLHCIKPGVVDDYGSLWMADAFDKSLATRMPTLCWSHDWSEPLGPALSYATSDDGPSIDFAFSDFDAVPMARRAHAQVMDGTIQDCSVGFYAAQRRDPTEDEVKAYPGIREVILEAQLDEVSLVLRGAVPGAKVLAARGAKVAVDAAVELARRVTEGELTQAEAKTALDLLAIEDPTEGEPDPPAPAVDHEALDAEVDAVLAARGR
jgi:HK97 family phage prohead protease